MSLALLIPFLSLFLRNLQFMGHPYHDFVVNQVPPRMLRKTKCHFAAATALLVRHRDIHLATRRRSIVAGRHRSAKFDPFTERFLTH
ncbi:MAG TPA: hypothetical protein VF510_05495 [Ktedonobacterales bacterium]